MQTISVKVQADHLERMTRVKKPVLAVAELIWNSVDADATLIQVVFDRTPLGATERIRVIDNGSGMAHSRALEAFASLGGSWKRTVPKTGEKGRLLHGRAGKGRFRAFSIGEEVTWRTVYRNGKGLKQYTIRGSASHIATFEVDDPADIASAKSGTEVVISSIIKNFTSLEGQEGAQEVAEQFAVYLREYPDVVIEYDGIKLDPKKLEKEVVLRELPRLSLDDGRTFDAELMIIEWQIESERSLFLCDRAGFTLDRTIPGIHAPGFYFSGYLRCDYLRELDEQGLLSLDEMHSGLSTLLGSARAAMREHFRARSATIAGELVAEWKAQNIYPYAAEPRSELEVAERQMFDVIALNVHSYMPGFGEQEPRQQRLSLKLLKQALQDSPAELRRILSDVLELPPEKQTQLAKLLEKTTLSAIISASKLVADRLNFLKSLEYLVFTPEVKDILLERQHLHRILENHTWLFGEEFNLTSSDQSLTEVLNKHLKFLGHERDDTQPVLREDGSKGIIDLMLSRRVPQPKTDEREHLVVELKRPAKKIDLDALTQVQSYAFAVAADERFRDTRTRWTFWAVSNEITDEARRAASQANRPEGVYYDDDRGTRIWVKTWGQLIEDCTARLNFFQTSLKYTPDDESALAYLKELHAAYLPPQVLSRAS